ncbi:MAG: flagellar basal body P-ring formation chaperone FlgA [Ghiorsea sp.]
MHNVAYASADVQQNQTEIKASLTAFFATKPMVHGATVEMVSLPHLPDIHGEIKWSLPHLHFLPKRVAIIAEQGHGKTMRRWYINTQVRWIANVVTLTQDISARSMLDRSMLKKAKTNIAGLRGQTWTDINDVVGLQSLRNLSKGSVVLSTQYKRPPLIKRGDLVTILANVAGIKVRAQGVALKSGSRGDRMLVKNTRSNQRLQSIVQDAHTVTVYVGGV